MGPIAVLLFMLTCLVIAKLILRFTNGSEGNVIRPASNDAILISGCDSGIGLELAKNFFAALNLKIICGFLNPPHSNGYQELSKLAETSSGHRLILLKLDLTSDSDVNDIAQSIERLRANGEIKSLLALINNAGTMTYGEFDWLTWTHIDHQIQVNLVGTIRLTRAILSHIIECRGKIINVSSVNDSTVFPGLSVYSATKSAISTFSRGLGYELRKFGVHVVTVRLGDFARLTNIMANHSSNQSDMWNGMDTRKRIMYNEFFHEFNRHLLRNYGMTSPKVFEQSSLFVDFKRAVLSRNPPTTITCAPLAYRLFYFLMELTPVWIQYHFLDVLIRFAFKWQPPQLVARQDGVTREE